jgi:hypothetical protein
MDKLPVPGRFVIACLWIRVREVFARLPDTTSQRANGLRLELSPRYDGLFRMLKSNRFDYFPRSVLEIWIQ